MADEIKIKFIDAVEIRRQEMRGILPNFTTNFEFGGKQATLRSATANERVHGDREGKVLLNGK